MSQERSPKRVRLSNNGISLILSSSSNTQSTEEIRAEIERLKKQLFEIHRQRSKLYYFVFDVTSHNILKQFSDGLINEQFMKTITKKVMLEVDVLKTKLVAIEHKIVSLESLLENE